MAGSRQERHGLAVDAGHRRRADGPPASLTAASRPAAVADGSRRDLLLGATASAGVVALSIGRATVLGRGAPGIAAGAGFAAVLLAPALLAPRFRRRLARPPRAWALAAGGGLGLLLLLPGAWLLAGGHHTATSLLPLATLGTWAPAVLLVATAEEVALRAGIQPWLRRALGPAPAIVLAAGVFAGLHYPLYGAAAMPLDLGVGIMIGALRQYTGSVSACCLAHGIADLGAWWLP